MQLSVEILDHIFSFLVSHRKTLIACSEDPLLAPIVEKHLHYQVVVYFHRDNAIGEVDAFEPDHLSRHFSENPRFLYYVRIVEVDFSLPEQVDRQAVSNLYCEFSKTLLMFPALECMIMLSCIDSLWPAAFQAALADRLNLATMKEIHLMISDSFPFSLLDNCKNIENLSLSGSLEAKVPASHSRLPQLKSITLYTEYSPSLLAWLKLHIFGLQSLRCGAQMLPELLEVCSGTLTNLDVDLEDSPYYNDHTFKTGTTDMHPFPDLSSVPCNLQLLTIRTVVAQYHDDNDAPQYCSSWLLAAGKIISLFISSGPPRRLALDINITIDTFSDLTEIDFSPLAVLGAASVLIPRIDLYVRTTVLPSALTRAQLLSSLEDYEGMVESIKKGVLVIHLEDIAPHCIEESWASTSTYEYWSRHF